jgi:hypothetical protein
VNIPHLPTVSEILTWFRVSVKARPTRSKNGGWLRSAPGITSSSFGVEGMNAI